MTHTHVACNFPALTVYVGEGKVVDTFYYLFIFFINHLKF